jgi:Tol biopolymer transport system component
VKRLVAVFGALALLAAAQQQGQESRRLKNLKQLTAGGQNAEAYWSPDGKQIVFQSTRPPYECDQIFVMNADGSSQRLVSTGKGRTTCGYFLKDGKHILYGSTHEADARCPTPPDRSRGYVWGVFPGFDIFVADLSGKIVRKLTDAPGYDAEGTVNFNNGKVLYTSLVSGDLDLWEMSPDGKNKRQLTSRLGYDGGAFYSRDGKQIVWRANYPGTPEQTARYKELLSQNRTSPMRMELMIADADGRNGRQLTNFGCACFAPSFTPDGKRIIFSSNKNDCDGRKFELFLINTDGTGLEQVTHFDAFSSFAEFSPDGKRLVFTSSHGAKERYEYNIFTADWAP